MSGRYGNQVRAIVLHSMGGTIGATTNWFHNPIAQVSAHYGVALDGHILQYVNTDDIAFANGILESGNRWPYTGNPNYKTISIETEDYSPIVSTEEFNSVKSLVIMLKKQYPTIELITSHHIISPINRPNCAGSRWTSSLIKQLGLPYLI